MTLKELIDSELFEAVTIGADLDRPLSTPYCCDLLSVAMSSVPEGAAWVTVMGNINTLAVASLTDAACIILAQNTVLDEAALGKAKTEGITILKSPLPIFDAALAVYQRLNG